MPRVLGILLTALFLTAPLDEKKEKADGPEKKWNFDGDQARETPKGFTSAAGEWKVAADASAPSKPNVLAQSARNKGSTFNLVLIDAACKDVKLSVQMKAVAGGEDQGGGLVWRAKDSKNYYVARYNPLESNYRVYKVVDGKRTTLQSADIPAAAGWHTLKIEMEGNHIECYFDGKKHLDVKDDAFKEAGKIGLWTKADAQTHFDDLKAEENGEKN
ncbi:MAG: DUF1080 domain-containing protein [Planctomycetes bacterium]|nr:DUF1080 domain-containing protein [Planctomycetota bacterium]